MSRLAICSGLDAVKAFRKIGYEIDHQTGRRLTIPNHRELAKGTLRALIRDAGLSKEQFTELL